MSLVLIANNTVTLCSNPLNSISLQNDAILLHVEYIAHIYK